MVERSGGLLTCLMPSVYPTDMLTGGILAWFGMFGAENASSDALQCIVIWACAFAATIAFDFASGGMLPCLMPVSLFIFDRWYPDMIWHVCCGMFWHVCFCQVVYWHVLANGCDLFTWTLLTGAILSSTQDTTRSCKNPENKDAELAAFEMHLLRSVWSLPANLLYFVRRLSASGPWNKTRWQP